MRRITEPAKEFETRFTRSHGCWLWKIRTKHAYPGFLYQGAHRFSYETYVGPIKPGNVIHHKCGEKYCVNPGHLAQRTPRQNTRIYFQVERKECPNGHDPLKVGVYVVPSTGARRCRACRQIQQTKADRKRRS